MDAPLITAGAALLLALAPIPVAADVTVKFVDPGAYTDIGRYGYDVAHNLDTLERHFTHLGKQCLGQGQSLDLRVLDVDLAGRFEWWRRAAYDVRVMNDITWPRVVLTYVWRDDAGQVLGEGRARIIDQSYLWRSAYVRNSSDELPYEKAMLRDWLGKTFCRNLG